MRHNITSSEAFEDRTFLGPGPGLVQHRRTHRLLRQRSPRRPFTLALMGGGLAAVAVLAAYGLTHLGL